MYRGVNDALVARIVVDVDCDAAEGGDFGSEFVEAGVVLSRSRVSECTCGVEGVMGRKEERRGGDCEGKGCKIERTVRVRKTGT
jgi:hypothetical protein